MALTKDTRYVSQLAELSGCMAPNEQASKLILASMELKLRAILQVDSVDQGKSEIHDAV